MERRPARGFTGPDYDPPIPGQLELPLGIPSARSTRISHFTQGIFGGSKRQRRATAEALADSRLPSSVDSHYEGIQITELPDEHKAGYVPSQRRIDVIPAHSTSVFTLAHEIGHSLSLDDRDGHSVAEMEGMADGFGTRYAPEGKTNKYPQKWGKDPGYVGGRQFGAAGLRGALPAPKGAAAEQMELF